MKTKLVSTLPPVTLAAYVTRQLNNMFPDDQIIQHEQLESLVINVFPALEHCFSHVNNRYFSDGSSVFFNHLHGDQYSMFLYLLSRVAYEQKEENNLQSKLFLLNKTLHGIDVYFEVELPSVFLFVHPLGTVLGRGRYQEFLTVYQRCGVGSNHNIYPRLGKYLTLHPGSSILGDCEIDDNVRIASESLVLDTNLGPNSLYVGKPGDFFTRKQDALPVIWR